MAFFYGKTTEFTFLSIFAHFPTGNKKHNLILLKALFMKKGILFILFVGWTLVTFSQTYLKVTPFDTLGVSNIHILYEMKFMPDTLDRTRFDKRMLLLEIGEKGLSRFTEYNNWRQDSIHVARTQNGKISDLDLIEVRKQGGRVYDRYHLLKGYPDASHLQLIGFAGIDKFVYTEEMPNFQWQLKPAEKKVIGGYTCSLAVGNYAGRTYQAWFTTEIPVSTGPWKLGGLPGLILEAEDTEGEYIYTCTRIQKKKGYIAVQGMDTAYKTTRERFLKAFHRAKSNPGAVIQSLRDKVQGQHLNKKGKRRAFNPQEKY